MSEDIQDNLYNNADKFIDLANEMTKASGTANIGVALRYAAARYCAFEASLGTENLAEHKDEHIAFFAKTFTEMLNKNFDEYIAMQEDRNKS